MFITPSSLTLSSIVLTSGISTSITHSATAYSFPGLLPLSTPLARPLNHTSTALSSNTYFSPGCRSSPPVEFSSTMPPPWEVVYPSYLSDLGALGPSSQWDPSVSVTLDMPGPRTDTRTSTGTSLPPLFGSSSNSDVSPSFTFRPAAPGTTSSLAISLSSSIPINSSCIPGLTSSPTTPPSRTASPPATISPSDSASSPLPSSLPPQPFSTSPVTGSASTTLDLTPTRVFSTTLVTSIEPPPSSSPNSPSTSTYTLTSVLPGQGTTTTEFVTTSSVLSTEPPGSNVASSVHLSPGTIAAIVLGVVGTFAFSALWLFCARRRHRKMAQEATLVPPDNHAPGPLDDEVLDVEELAYGVGSIHSAENSLSQTGQVMEEHYAGILAALHSTEGFGRGNEGGSTGGIYGSRHDTATDMGGDDDIVEASSPTLPLHVLPPDDPPYMVPLSPPPPASQPSHHQAAQPTPPPSAYYLASRRKSSPGPDAAAWPGGYSVAPSCHSYYARSHTLGSGSRTGSVDALTRTRTGSEEPLLGIGKMTVEASGASTPGGISLTTATDPGGNRPGFGSAFGSPAGSVYSPSSVYPALQHDTTGSYGTRSASGSGSYVYPRSGTPNSFDVLRSVSSQGALSSVYSQGQGQTQGFRFGFGRQGSSSSGSTGKKAGSYRQSFGVPPTTFRSWKDRGSAASDKERRGEKQSLREKDSKQRPRSWTSASASGSVDEKQGRGSPVGGVRALLGRLRRAGNTPSPHSSNRDLPSPTKTSIDADLEKTATGRTTPPPIRIEAATPHRRRFSFILSNPDPHPPSPYSGVDVIPASGTPPHQEPCPIQKDPPTCNPKPAFSGAGGLQPATPLPTRYVFAPAPSPAPTEESRLAEDLLHPRLRTQGYSDASLRDFEDYSRPIGGVVKNRLYSTTTFGTQDEADRSPGRGTPVQDVLSGDELERENDSADIFGSPTLRGALRDSWLVVESSPPPAIRHSPGSRSIDHRS